MNILGIGPLEFFLIIVLMLVVLGPRNMVATGRKAGEFIRKIIRSPMWREMMQTQQQIRDIPNTIIRDANLEETLEELKTLPQDVQKEIDISKEVQEINKIPTEIAAEVDTQHSQALRDPVSPVKPGSVAPVEIPKPQSTVTETEQLPADQVPPTEDNQILPPQAATEEAAQPHPEPSSRRRGRPKKVAAEVSPLPEEAPAPKPRRKKQPEAEQEFSGQAPKKPRGRPRKAESTPQADAVEPAETVEAATQPEASPTVNN